MTCCYYLGVWNVTKKGIRTQFSNLGMQCPLKPESDLNHASLLQILGVTNLRPTEPYWKGNF